MQKQIFRIIGIFIFVFLVFVSQKGITGLEETSDCTPTFQLTGYTGDPSGCIIYFYRGSSLIDSCTVNSSGNCSVSLPDQNLTAKTCCQDIPGELNFQSCVAEIFEIALNPSNECQ
jgi:hypothetical protein